MPGGSILFDYRRGFLHSLLRLPDGFVLASGGTELLELCGRYL